MKTLKLLLLGLLSTAAFAVTLTPCKNEHYSEHSEQNDSVFTKAQQDSIVLKQKEVELEQLQSERAKLDKSIAEIERYIDSCNTVK